MNDNDTLSSSEYTEWDYKEWPCKVFSLANILTQQGLCYYVWDYEGGFDKNGKWKFHKGPIIDGGTEIPDHPRKPLLVDQATAGAFKAVYEAVNDKNKQKLCEYAQSRGLFCWACETLVWPNVGFKSA